MTINLNNSQYFTQHPDKVLGIAYTASGRWGEVTKYKGYKSDLERIIESDYATLPLTLDGTVIQAPAAAAIRSTQVAAPRDTPQVAERIRKATLEAKTVPIEQVRDEKFAEGDIVTFQEVDERYNAHISRAEKEAFVQYMLDLGRSMAGGWRKYRNGDKNEWLRSGAAFYENGKIVPAFIYLSGNVWEKSQQLAADREIIVEQYGQAAFDAQEAAMKAKLDERYRSRLLLDDPNEERRLVIKPTSDWATNFKVQNLRSYEQMKVKMRTKAGKKMIDFAGTREVSDYKKETMQEAMSLQEWFIYWMSSRNDLTFRYGLDWSQLYQLAIKLRNRATEEKKEEFARDKANAKMEAQRFFSRFLIEELELEDKLRLETEWNLKYTYHVEVDLHRVPIGFSHARYYSGIEVDIRSEKREAIAFAMIKGSASLAYGVGLGKTWCAVFIMAQFMENGWASRPLLTVPNQVYKQFMNEIRGITPQYPINDLYNLGRDYEQKLQLDESTKEKTFELLPFKSITMLTYEGFRRIGLGDLDGNDMRDFQDNLQTILSQKADLDDTAKQSAKRTEKLEGRTAKAAEGTFVNIRELGLDMLLVDEAHSMKKVFTEIRSKGKEERSKKSYNLSSGTPSALAAKGFMIAQYIQSKYQTGNCLILTATPFTNSPLEVFSMLALINYRALYRLGFYNLERFFDEFAQIEYQLTISPTLKPQYKEVFTGFTNLTGLQSLIKDAFLYKNTTDTIKRPNKIVLPLREKVEEGVIVPLGSDEKVETVLPMTELQRDLMLEIMAYADNKVEVQLVDAGGEDENEDGLSDTGEDAAALDVDMLSGSEKLAVRLLKAMNWMRGLTLSPYLFKGAKGLPPINAKNYIETSAKLHYTMQCIASVKAHHERTGTPVSGQVIYMNRGVDYFELIAEYLVKEVGYAPHEVGIIKSAMPKGKDKSWVQDRFLGRSFDETQREFVDITDQERIKVLIGSATIKEGINLQKYGTVLYNLYLDWNPTDVVQLEGRIWRQGNLYKNVRIVNPLGEDSMDIFMFQKLEEKTERINAIWDFTSNTSSLSLTDFNPRELKYLLIKDPVRVARLEMDEVVEEMKEQKDILQRQLEGFQTFSKKRTRIFERIDQILAFAQAASDSPITDEEARANPKKLIDLVTRVVAKQTIKGIEINKIIRLDMDVLKLAHANFICAWDGGYASYNSLSSSTYQYSSMSKPYWWQDWVDSVRFYNRMVQDVLIPKGIDPTEDTQLADFQERLKEQITEIEEQIKIVNGDDYLRTRAVEIDADRKSKGIRSASVAERVEEFAKLNYLLDDTMATSAAVIELPSADVKKYMQKAFAALDAAKQLLNYLKEKRA
jgi:Type III restriction enzyme, res subunit/Helicase conserved C-terminal domain